MAACEPLARPRASVRCFPPQAQLDLGKLFQHSRSALKREFEAACKAREQPPFSPRLALTRETPTLTLRPTLALSQAREKSRSLFGSLIMSCPTLVALLTDRGLLCARVVTPRASTTGGKTSDVEVSSRTRALAAHFAQCNPACS